MIPDFTVQRRADGNVQVEIKNLNGVTGMTFYLFQQQTQDMGDVADGLFRPLITNVSGADGKVSVFWVYVPSAPTITSAAPTNNGLIVNFTPPQSDGNLPIIDYEYAITTTQFPEETEWIPSGQSATPLIITGLPNLVPQKLKIRAVNSYGTFFESNVIEGTPELTTLWLIRTGFWDDSGEWDDNETWIDNP